MPSPADSLRAVAQSLRRSEGFQRLSPRERLQLDEDLRRIEGTLASGRPAGSGSPALAGNGARRYARGQATPADLHAAQPLQPGGQAAEDASAPAPPAPAPPPPPPPATETIGGRAAAALEAVDFSGFVAGLVTGTFQAIVDASVQQIREYAQLVASLARSVDDFARENVSEAQIRDWLANRHPADLRVELPAPGAGGAPRLRPRAGHEGTTPDWLRDYGLEDEELSDELTEGALLRAGRPRVAEERMQMLATMVLMGINRVVIQDGNIRAKMQFHASARDRTGAEALVQGIGQQLGIAQRQAQLQSATATMVSTVKANAQADASIKAELMGEIDIKFRSETFPLERFADSAAIQLLTRHARFPAPASRTDGAQNGAAVSNGAGAEGSTAEEGAA